MPAPLPLLSRSLGAITACLLNLLLPSERAMVVPEPSAKGLPTTESGISPEPSVYYRSDKHTISDSAEPSTTYKAPPGKQEMSAAAVPAAKVWGGRRRGRGRLRTSAAIRAGC